MSRLGTLSFSTRKWVIKAMFQTSQFLKSIYFESKGTKEMWRFFRQIIKKGEITAWKWKQAVCTEQLHMVWGIETVKIFRPTTWKQQGYHLKLPSMYAKGLKSSDIDFGGSHGLCGWRDCFTSLAGLSRHKELLTLSYCKEITACIDRHA